MAGILDVVCEQQASFELQADWLQPSMRGRIAWFADDDSDDLAPGITRVCVVSHNHGLQNSDKVTITGNNPFNGEFTIEGIQTNTFFISAQFVNLPDEFDGEWEKRGEPYNLNGWTAIMQIRHRSASTQSPLIHEASTANGQAVVTAAVNGRVKVLIPGEITAGFTPGPYVYDLLLINTDPNEREIKRLLEGEFRVTNAVTLLSD